MFVLVRAHPPSGNTTGHLHDTFTTVSGKEVDLWIYSEHKNVGQLDHAMQSLKRSMVWDELKYGREYDLGIFNIVAVEDFNMGAMENKSLNIFNTVYVRELARRSNRTCSATLRVPCYPFRESWWMPKLKPPPTAISPP